MKKGLILGLCAVLAVVAIGDAQGTGGKPVKFQGAGRELTGVLFEPEGPGPFPAVIDIHGINGQNEWDFEVGRRLAELGYVTIAIDLFGRRSRDYADGLHQRDQFRPKVPDDLKATVSYLTTLKNVIPTRIGTVGWCMGGGYALLLAVNDPRLAAAVVYYGPVTPPPGPAPEDLKNIHAPILAHFGKEDFGIPMASVKMWANNLKEAGKHIELHWYDAGHGFAEVQTMPPTHGEHREDGPAEVSWQRTLAFLKTYLKDGKS
jgi:carboxymethylenebutenolidase